LRPRSTSITCSALLQVAKKLLLEAQIFGPVRASTPRSREGPCLDSPALDLHQLLGRGADHVAVGAEREEEHVRRRIDRAQAAVHVERAGAEVLAESLRYDDLKRIAGEDVLARRIHHGVELARRHVRLPSSAVDPGRWRRHPVRSEPPLHLVDAGDRLAVVLAVRPVDREQPEAPGDVVEDGEVLGAQKRRLRHWRRRACGERKPLEVPRGLIAQVAHGAAMESGDARHR
jgi:hypothetical protein